MKKKLCLISIILGGALLLAAAGVGLYWGLSDDCLYTVVDAGQSKTVRTFSRDAEEILQKAGTLLEEYDIYKEEKTDRGTRITVLRAQKITVYVENKAQTAYTQPVTVEALLKSLNVSTIAPWQVSVPLREQTYDGMELRVDRVEEKAYTRQEETPFEILYCNDPSLPLGTEEIVRPGIPGSVAHTGQAVFVNGELESFTASESTVQTEPTPQVVAVGTGEKEGESRKYPLIGESFLYTAAGDVLYYSYVDTYNATAYTSWIEDVTGTTACGTPARVGAVAVDPKVIPYFTKMYIVSKDGVFDYGVSSAEDCGGAVKGKIIDLFFNTLEDCYAFGRRDIYVYFLTDEPT